MVALVLFFWLLDYFINRKKSVQPVVESEFDRQIRQLAFLRQKYEANAKAYPKEQDALEQLFNTARRQIIERGMGQRKPDDL